MEKIDRDNRIKACLSKISPAAMEDATTAMLCQGKWDLIPKIKSMMEKLFVQGVIHEAMTRPSPSRPTK